MKIRTAELLHNTQGGSDKYYFAIELEDGNYLTMHGGRYKSPALNFHNKTNKKYGNFLDNTKQANYKDFWKVLNEKKGKGYNKIKDINVKEVLNNPKSQDGKLLYDLLPENINTKTILKDLIDMEGINSNNINNIDMEEAIKQDKLSKENAIKTKMKEEEKVKTEKEKMKELKKALNREETEFVFF